MLLVNKVIHRKLSTLLWSGFNLWVQAVTGRQPFEVSMWSSGISAEYGSSTWFVTVTSDLFATSKIVDFILLNDWSLLRSPINVHSISDYEACIKQKMQGTESVSLLSCLRTRQLHVTGSPHSPAHHATEAVPEAWWSDNVVMDKE